MQYHRPDLEPLSFRCKGKGYLPLGPLPMIRSAGRSACVHRRYRSLPIGFRNPHFDLSFSSPPFSYRITTLFWIRECYARNPKVVEALSGASCFVLICIATTVVRPSVLARASCGTCDVTCFQPTLIRAGSGAATTYHPLFPLLKDRFSFSTLFFSTLV